MCSLVYDQLRWAKGLRPDMGGSWSVGLKLKVRRPSRKTLPRYGHQSGERAIRLTIRNCGRNSPTSRQLWGIRNSYSSNNGTKHTPLNEANFLYKSDEHCHWVKEVQLKWLEDASVRCEYIQYWSILFVSLKLYGMYVFVSCCTMHSCGSNFGACVYCGISLPCIPFVASSCATNDYFSQFFAVLACERPIQTSN